MNTSSGPGAGRPSTPRSVRSKAERGEVEEGVVAGGFGDDQLRRCAARAAREARLEAAVALGVGHRLAEHVVVDGDEAELRPGDRLGGRKRADDRVDAVVAGERGQAEVGDDEPLRGDRAPFVAVPAVGAAR